MGSDPAKTPDEDFCPICFDDFTNEKPLRVLRQCGHYYHPKCVEDWFLKSNELRCPICRLDHRKFIPTDQLEGILDRSEPIFSVVSVEMEANVYTGPEISPD